MDSKDKMREEFVEAHYKKDCFPPHLILLITTLISVEIAFAHTWDKCGKVKCVEMFSTLNKSADRVIFPTLINAK